jgi:hypothetical protein
MFIAGEPDEAGNEQIGRAVIEVERAADLFDAAAIHDDEPVGQRHGLDLVVRDVDEVAPRRWCSGLISARMATRSLASRLESGSSNRNTFGGSRTMARPMATRWRWPPESGGATVEQKASGRPPWRRRGRASCDSAFGTPADLEA